MNAPGPHRVLRFAGFTLDPATGELRSGTASVRIADKPLALLLVLLERPRGLVTRDELRARLWPEALAADFDNSLNAAVKRLRDSLGDDAAEPRFIETLPRRGYRFAADVETSGSRGRRGAVAAVLGTLLVASLAGSWFGAARVDPPSGSEAPLRLLVLPLEAGPRDEGAAAGLTEELTATLAALAPDQLVVLASTSARAARDAGWSVGEIRRRLGVARVVEGGVRSEGGRTRVTLRLVDGTSEAPLWAQSWDLRFAGGLDLQESVALRVAEALRLSVPALQPRLPRSRGISPASLEDYWRAQRALRETLTPAAASRARAALERAIARDPGFGAAHAALAELDVLILQVQPSRAVAERAERSAREAIRLEGASALGHAALAVACLYRWDLEAAREAAARSLALDPGQASHQQWASLVYSALGEHSRALEAARRAEVLDPLSWAVNLDLGWAYYYARDFGSAVRHEREARARWPAAGPLPWFVPLSLHLSGRGDEAVDELRADLEARAIAPASRQRFARAAEGGAFGVAGWALEVFARQADRGSANTQMLVRLHALRGERDEAFRWLSRAVADGAGWLAYLAVDPALDALRSDARLGEVAALVGGGSARRESTRARQPDPPET